MIPKTNQRNYKVGYAKPPKDSQFQKGQSGNPSGRPKGTLNIASTFEQALQEKIVIKENGHRKTVTKLEAGAKKWASQVAAGDSQAFKLMPGLIGVARSEQEKNETAPLTETDPRVQVDFVHRNFFPPVTGKRSDGRTIVDILDDIYGLTNWKRRSNPVVPVPVPERLDNRQLPPKDSDQG